MSLLGWNPGWIGQYLIHLNLSNLLRRRIAVCDPITIINENHPLFHGGKNGFRTDRFMSFCFLMIRSARQNRFLTRSFTPLSIGLIIPRASDGERMD